MSVCVPRHIICDTYDPSYTPSSAPATLPVQGAARRARSGPTLGTVWRSTGFGPTANQTTIRVTWQNIRRFNGFEFSSPPSQLSVGTSTEYVEIDVKIDVFVDGNLVETYFDDSSNNPLYIQTAEWQLIDTNDDGIDDSVGLCWSCTDNTIDTSDIIDVIRNDINNNSLLITLPLIDKQSVVDPGPPQVTWDASTHESPYIGGDYSSNASALDTAASNNNPYAWPDISLSGASLTTVSDQTGPFFSLVLATDSEVGNDDGELTPNANDLLYFGQQTTPNCYSAAWLPYLPSSDLDCGMPINGFDSNQNAFIVDDTVGSEIQSGDRFMVYGPLIDDAPTSTPAEFGGNYRMPFNVTNVNQPGDGTTKITVSEQLPNLHSRYQAVGANCPSASCF